MKSLLSAFRFLTVFPFPGDAGAAEDDLARSVLWFPLVGLTLGGLAAGLAWGLSPVASPMLVAALIVVLLLAVSGGLHCDGLADTADGFFSAKPRDSMLEIMKDSRTGAMGVMAIVCVLLVKFAALASLPPDTVWAASLLTPLAGRTAIVVHMALLPHARPSGLGTLFYRRSQRWNAAWSVAILAATGWLVLGHRGLAVAAVGVGVAALASGYVYRKIGGATGDTFGAVCEVVEVVPALVLALSLGPMIAAR
jgi:adenosylcobinamide-GDP ribazoletransferase